MGYDCVTEDFRIYVDKLAEAPVYFGKPENVAGLESLQTFQEDFSGKLRDVNYGIAFSVLFRLLALHALGALRFQRESGRLVLKRFFVIAAEIPRHVDAYVRGCGGRVVMRCPNAGVVEGRGNFVHCRHVQPISAALSPTEIRPPLSDASCPMHLTDSDQRGPNHKLI